MLVIYLNICLSMFVLNWNYAYQFVLVASRTSPSHKPQISFDIKVSRFEHFALPTCQIFETPKTSKIQTPNMPSVQNSET